MINHKNRSIHDIYHIFIQTRLFTAIGCFMNFIEIYKNKCTCIIYMYVNTERY